jgi:hypothetical protein
MRDAVGLAQRDDLGVGKVYDIPGGLEPWHVIWRLTHIAGSGRRVKREEGAVDDLPGPAKLQEFTLPTSGSHSKGKADHELDIPGAGK